MIFRLTLLLVFIGLVSFSLAAQAPTPVPEDWRVMQPSNEEFIIDAPLALKITGDERAKSSRMYFGSINGTYVYVFSDPVKSPNNLSVVKRFVSLSGKTLEADKDPAKTTRLAFADTFGYWQNIIMLRTETRIYIAQTVSKNENNAVVDRFISSFSLGTERFKEAEKIEIMPAESNIPIVSPTTSPTPSGNSKGGGMGTGFGQGSGIGSGSGQGNGTGSGSGSGTGTGSVNAPPPLQTRPLRILSKPRPAYTDFARFYWITGTVILRVTFLASGEIGDVTSRSSLPFGLTQRAIEAAKSMRFEPMTRDGNPMSVTKQVEYSFLIY